MARPVPSAFGRRLRELRLWVRLSPEQVAVRAKLHPCHIRKLELGYSNNPSLDTAQKIAKALGVTIEMMLQ